MTFLSRSLAIGFIALVPSLEAAVQLPPVFGNSMVLQQNKPLPIWGTAAAGEKITVEFAGQTKTAIAATDGKWMLKLDPIPASTTAAVFKVSGVDSKVEFQDVVIGEVWFCSGQSNMAYQLSGILNLPAERQPVANPNLRYFNTKWVGVTPTSAGACSAVAYFFGVSLQKELGIPVGLIVSAVGGTPAEFWVAAETQMADPDLGPGAKKAMELAKQDEVKLPAYAAQLKEFVPAYSAWQQANGRVPTDDAAAFEAFAKGGPAAADAKVVTLPQPLVALGFPDGGVYWLRKEVELPASIKGPQQVAFLAYDFADAYFNGTKIGGNKVENLPAKGLVNSILPAELAHPGKAILAIRMIDDTGAGGNFGPAGSIRLGPLSLPDGWTIQRAQAYPKLSAEALAARPVAPTAYHAASGGRPGVLFDRCVALYVPYALAGVIWYQGESNAGNAWTYRKLFPLLITDWRKYWGDETLPFYFCQLASFQTIARNPGDDMWAELREAQLLTLKLPHTGQAVLIDLGEEGDIHPQRKAEVGDRLALIALNQSYQKGGEYSGPLYQGMKIDGDKVRLSFTHLGGGLVAKPLPETHIPIYTKPVPQPLPRNLPGSALEGFAICGADRQWVWADAKIEGDQVVVSSPKVPAPVAVRYAWAGYPVCNLYNQAGLPASPFRTDDFKLTTVPANP